jgi:hypothetical protein
VFVPVSTGPWIEVVTDFSVSEPDKNRDRSVDDCGFVIFNADIIRWPRLDGSLSDAIDFTPTPGE